MKDEILTILSTVTFSAVLAILFSGAAVIGCVLWVAGAMK